MMLAFELRAKADRLRDLALRSKDDAIRSELLYLASEYEQAAAEGVGRPVSQVAPTTFPG